jgi:GTP-binding protein
MHIDPSKIRNIAIIAHVDHGKTTLVDAFMKQSNLFRDNQDEMSQEMILDSGDLEREKGITITAKNIAIRYGEYKINIIDTPGHADFGGEVERTLNMADGCILLVDAQEGPKPQTKFVLKRALELGLRPLLIINKIDKKYAEPAKILNRVHDLFLNLVTDADQLEFPVLYAIGREGKVFAELPEGDMSIPNTIPGDLKPLLDAIVAHVPAPKGDVTGPFQMQITSLEYDAHQGRYLIGKINRGVCKKGDAIVVINTEGKELNRGRVKELFVREGLGLSEIPEAPAGEIVAIAGVETTAIGATVCVASNLEPLPDIKISAPSVRIKFEANTSPFVGKEGQFVTAKVLQQRLEREKDLNIGLEITKSDEGYYVAGRGELQLSILIETLRREGYEFQIRKPEVVLQTIDGVLSEPIEELLIETTEEYSNAVAATLSTRKAEIVNIESENDQVRYTYKILTRNILGLRNILLTNTKGNVSLNNYVLGYVPYKEQPEPFRQGVLISSEDGTAMAYTLNMVQWRGELFIEPATLVYEGMIVGVNKYEDDLEVNVTKARHKSGVRVNQAQITHVSLKTPLALTLDFALVFLAKDEILEVTPKNLRLRKVYLKGHERKRAHRDTK